MIDGTHVLFVFREKKNEHKLITEMEMLSISSRAAIGH